MRADDLYVPDHDGSPMATLVWGVMKMSRARANAVWCKPCSKWFRAEKDLSKSMPKFHTHCLQCHYEGEDGLIYSKRPNNTNKRSKRKEQAPVTDSSPGPATAVTAAVAQSVSKPATASSGAPSTPAIAPPAPPKSNVAAQPPAPQTSNAAAQPKVQVAPPTSSGAAQPKAKMQQPPVAKGGKAPAPPKAPTPSKAPAPSKKRAAPKLPWIPESPSESPEHTPVTSDEIVATQAAPVTAAHCAPNTVQAESVAPMDTSESRATSNGGEHATTADAPAAAAAATAPAPTAEEYKARLKEQNRPELVRQRGYKMCPVSGQARAIAERAQRELYQHGKLVYKKAAFVMPNGTNDALDVIKNGAQDNDDEKKPSWKYTLVWAQLHFFQSEMAALGLKFVTAHVMREPKDDVPAAVEDWFELRQLVKSKKKKKKSKSKPKDAAPATDEPPKKKQKAGGPGPDAASVEQAAVAPQRAASPMTDEARQAEVDALEDEPPTTPERPAATQPAAAPKPKAAAAPVAAAATRNTPDAPNPVDTAPNTAAAPNVAATANDGVAENGGASNTNDASSAAPGQHWRSSAATSPAGRTRSGRKRKSTASGGNSNKARVPCDEVIDLT